MSRLNDLLRELRTREPALARDLEREVAALADRRAFGLNFERHVPEAVDLPGRKARKGDKVRILPPRGQMPKRPDEKLWRVVRIDRSTLAATLERFPAPVPDSEEPVVNDGDASLETMTASVDDLVVVAEFRDPIYPGLVSTGKVQRGGDKPFHTVINAENFHALQTLLFTHRGGIDVIYIDPPYNTGAKDWKYNNDFVEGDDLYRHSKWLAFMERRLLLAKELLNPEDSVLIVTIDEKEYQRLGLLLEQTFPDAMRQMVSTQINPKGTGRINEFRRVDEYVFFVWLGKAQIGKVEASEEGEAELGWQTFRRRDLGSKRGTSKGGPRQFYPIYVSVATGHIEGFGVALSHGVNRASAPKREGCVAVFPIRPDGTEMNWGAIAQTAEQRWRQGYMRAGQYTPDEPQKFQIQYLKSGPIAALESGAAKELGRAADGSIIGKFVGDPGKVPTTQWAYPSHNSEHYGTVMVRTLLAGRQFPFPKSLYAVEDALRLFIGAKPSATIIDFFAGSGTTAHAVMRLNRQDGGRRTSISVTNNEVAAGEQKSLRENRLRPGDPKWEQWGICEYITKPRIEAAVTGTTPGGEPIEGNYKFGDESPIADGFEENVEFFTLTYEAPLRVASNREFAKIAPLLWIRAGSRGRRIDDISAGWDVADVYAVIANLDHTQNFLKAIVANDDVEIAYIVTDEERLFESIAQALPEHVEPVRLYEAYLRNFEIESGRGSL